MKHLYYSFLLAVASFALFACDGSKEKSGRGDNDTITVQKDSAEHVAVKDDKPEGAAQLLAAYPDQRMKFEDNKIVFPDGTALTYDDGKEKDFVEKLDNSDVEDMFTLQYDTDGEPDYLADAGRSRCEELFKTMYGHSAAEVQKHLVDVSWFGSTVKFTSVNGANVQLKKVADEIEATHPDMKKYMKCCGTFYWRQVRGANRQSAHSYGIAIDINTDYSDYWLWKYPGKEETAEIKYVNRIPLEIVEVFEKHGFVWGGRWYHFDTMHFEYRPEINPIKENYKE